MTGRSLSTLRMGISERITSRQLQVSNNELCIDTHASMTALDTRQHVTSRYYLHTDVPSDAAAAACRRLQTRQRAFRVTCLRRALTVCDTCHLPRLMSPSGSGERARHIVNPVHGDFCNSLRLIVYTSFDSALETSDVRPPKSLIRRCP